MVARDKSVDGGNQMSVVDGVIADARQMSDFMLRQKFRGPGDTIERAAYEAQRDWGAPASIMLRLRRRQVTDMLLSNWVQISAAYRDAVAASERQAQHQEYLARAAGINETNSPFAAAAAALVAGPKDGAAQ